MLLFSQLCLEYLTESMIGVWPGVHGLSVTFVPLPVQFVRILKFVDVCPYSHITGLEVDIIKSFKKAFGIVLLTQIKALI